MIEANIIARTHFTTKADGQTAFWQFCKEVNLLDSGIEWQFESGIFRNNKPVMYTADSWGGYVNSDGEWIVFICWRTGNGKLTKYTHWSWDSENRMPFNRRDMGFVG